MSNPSEPTDPHIEMVKTLSNEIKIDMEALLEKYAARAAKLARNSTDPHTPVVSTAQLSFAQAAAEWLIKQGLVQNLAAGTVLNVTAQAMAHWHRAILQHAKALADSKRAVLHMPEKGIN